MVSDAKSLEVIKISHKDERRVRPLGLNTVELLKAALADYALADYALARQGQFTSPALFTPNATYDQHYFGPTLLWTNTTLDQHCLLPTLPALLTT